MTRRGAGFAGGAALPLVPALVACAWHRDVLAESLLSPLLLIVAGSVGAFWLTAHVTPGFKALALRAGLSGRDLAKPGDKRIPEAMGIVAATVYLCTIILFQLFSHQLHLPLEYNAATTSICFMVFLGFADDVLDLRWRYKLVFPAVAALPLLVAYSAYGGGTVIMLPHVWPLSAWFGPTVNLGVFYLVYMLLLAVFCTNSINIHAGLNGLEAGQSYVIACAVLLHNVVEIAAAVPAADAADAALAVAAGAHRDAHLFSLLLAAPFAATALGLLVHNWYPSEVFVGDTFTFFAGMTLAVMGILGHFSKTMVLFFIPQIINFAISLPQLVGVWPCPRHRLPQLDPATGTLQPVAGYHTLVNWALRIAGRCTERVLVLRLLALQVACCAAGFWVRYGLAQHAGLFPHMHTASPFATKAQ